MTSPDTKLIACPLIKIAAAKQGPAGATGRAAGRGGALCSPGLPAEPHTPLRTDCRAIRLP